MTKQLTSLIGTFIVSVLLSPSIVAAPVTWTLDTVGEFVVGTFDYDPDTDVYSNVNVTTVHVADIFNNFQIESFSSSCGLYACSLLMSGDNGYSGIQLRFDPNLADALAVGDNSVDLDYLDSYYFNDMTPDGYTYNISGNVTASVVPIPATVWLFGSALAGLGWMRRKQTV